MPSLITCSRRLLAAVPRACVINSRNQPTFRQAFPNYVKHLLLVPLLTHFVGGPVNARDNRTASWETSVSLEFSSGDSIRPINLPTKIPGSERSSPSS